MDPNDRDSRRMWAASTLFYGVLLAAFSVALFAGLFAFDHYATGGVPDHGAHGPIARYWQLDPDHITDSVSALGGMIAAVLGIVITVVSIIVQLSANRYTGVARMFLGDRINLAVMAYYVVACIGGVWMSMSVHADFVPRATVFATMAATTGGLVLMGPYFAYVFWFVEPVNIIARIRRDAMLAATSGAQADALAALEELTDITSNSISGKDKIIASRAVDALKDFALEYLAIKPRAAASWFAIGPGIRENPDFVAMDPESLADLEERHTWVEWKTLRQYLGIYNEALATMRDITYLIAIDTRYIGEAAARANDAELVALVFRYMNSYLRATLNARDVRTAYNVLNQYRLLVEAMLRLGQGKAAVEAVRHMAYYADVSFDSKLSFVTETVAYDLCAICQAAHDLRAPEEEAVLAELLDLDRPTHLGTAQEKPLIGVRKAQVKLAAYYLDAGEEAKARRIAGDMAHEPVERLVMVRDQLERVATKDFWEIIDRGRNFEYMPASQRTKMSVFFSWMKLPASTRPVSVATPAAESAE